MNDHKSEQVRAHLQLESFLPYRLVVLASRVSQALAHRYDEAFGLTIPEWRVLATLGQFGQRTAKTIAEHSQMDKIKVSRAVSRLSDKGLIAKIPDPDDGRRTYLALSERGRRVYDEIVPQARAYETALLEGLGRADRQELDRIIDALTRRADEI